MIANTTCTVKTNNQEKKRKKMNLFFFYFYLNSADYNLLRVAQAPCLLSFVTWPQCYGFKQKCAMAQCTPTAQFSISTLPLAQFHYPQGIQGVMASRARNPVGHFKFFAQTFLVIVQELRVSVWRDGTEYWFEQICTANRSCVFWYLSSPFFFF